jgi:hypothetical protein
MRADLMPIVGPANRRQEYEKTHYSIHLGKRAARSDVPRILLHIASPPPWSHENNHRIVPLQSMALVREHLGQRSKSELYCQSSYTRVHRCASDHPERRR